MDTEQSGVWPGANNWAQRGQLDAKGQSGAKAKF